MRSVAIALVFLVACSSSSNDGTSDPEFADGFSPPAAQEGELRVIAPSVDVPPSSDLTWCTYVTNPFGREVDVVASRGFQSKFGHHAILMEVLGAEKRLGESHECTDSDMTNARYLAGGSDAAARFKIPEGIGFRIGTASVLMIQTHWINTSKEKILGQTVFNVGVRDPDPNRQQAQLFAALTLNVSLPPRAPARAQTECVIKNDLKFFAIGGHAHEWGSHVRLDVDRKGATNEVLYDHDWEPHFQADPPLTYYDLNAALELHAGDVLHVTCDYQNTTDDEIHFPREMCVGIGFYFPGTSDIQCADGQWISGGIGGVQ
jgi:hypothetical protein